MNRELKQSIDGRCNDYATPSSVQRFYRESAVKPARAWLLRGEFMRPLSGETRFLWLPGTVAAWRERRVAVTVDYDQMADGP
jgi:hypothetical protein